MKNKKEILLSRVRRLHAMFHNGQIPRLAVHEVYPDLARNSRENYLYFTLAPCLNFQRQSPALWRSALETWEDSETNYLFFPERVVNFPFEKIQSDLMKHKLALQKNKHPEIWTRICGTLHAHFHDDPREVLAEGKFDAERIIQLLREERKKDFPYLSGPKMANYWLYILSQFTEVELKNMNAISIIPDTHVLQCSIHLGMANEKADSEEVAKVWKELLEGSELTPVQMHPVLWNWSRNNFLPEV